MPTRAAGRPPEHPEGRIAGLVHRLDPSDFAAVMATGIVSSALHLVGHDRLSVALLLLAVLAYLGLVAATVWRLLRWPAAAVADAEDPARGFGYLTFVAATGVLAARLAADDRTTVTAVLLVVALLGWLVLSYGVPLTLLLHRHAAPVLADANGTWFMWTVATQSLAVTSADLVRLVPGLHPRLALFAVSSWSVGLLLYVVLVGLVATRLLAYPLAPEGLTPSYWIFMGATAITVLAGARLLTTGAVALVPIARPVVGGLSLALWAFGTWLVPLLLVGSVWRHVRRGAHGTYDPGLWAVVFPLGMYAVASLDFGAAARLPLLGRIGRAEAWVAVAAWLLVAAAALVQVAGGRRRGSPAQPTR